MTRFYDHLWREKLAPIESLRRAQLDMLEGRLPVGGARRGIGPPEAADPNAVRAESASIRDSGPHGQSAGHRRGSAFADRTVKGPVDRH